MGLDFDSSQSEKLVLVVVWGSLVVVGAVWRVSKDPRKKTKQLLKQVSRLECVFGNYFS